jgi:MSHA biogenesis protein MshJ
MKQRLLLLAERIDARTLRERALMFVTAALTIVFLLAALLLNPLLAKRTALRAELSQQRGNIAGIDGEITAKVLAYATDPDAASRSRLATVNADTARLATSLRAMQKGLVPPERIAPLLEAILRSNGRLQLVSMTTLPAGPLGAPATPAPANAAAPAAPVNPHELLYRHGVELTVRGNYLDMVKYLDALEAMPTQLFWGQAALQVEEYPNSRLTLTLYTLSLDRKWIKL